MRQIDVLGSQGQHLADAIRQWLEQPELVASATAAARARQFKSWETHADELICWLRELPRRDAKT